MVERDGLENRCGRKPTEGSNPSLSAIIAYVWQIMRMAGCVAPCPLLHRIMSCAALNEVRDKYLSDFEAAGLVRWARR